MGKRSPINKYLGMSYPSESDSVIAHKRSVSSVEGISRVRVFSVKYSIHELYFYGLKNKPDMMKKKGIWNEKIH